MNPEENFFQLYPDVIIKALEDAGFNPTGQCLQLNSLENRVYSLMLEDNSHAVMKFYRPGRWNIDQILEEHDFINDLVLDEIPVCAPLILSNNKTIMETEGMFYSVWQRTGGRIPEEFSEEMLMTIGRLIARLHNNGAVKQAKHRLKMNSENFILKPLKFLTDNNFIPKLLVKEFEKYALGAAHALNESLKDVPVHRIHGDCHWGNLLHNDRNLFFLDFDDFVTGPAVQDIWMIAPAIDARGIADREILIEGYRQFRNFETRWLHAVNPLKASRYINYAAWIAKRIDDPTFKNAFPNFGTEEYWEKETSDLEHMIKEGFEPEYIRESENIPKEDHSKLTNKDYFFDM